MYIHTHAAVAKNSACICIMLANLSFQMDKGVEGSHFTCTVFP